MNYKKICDVLRILAAACLDESEAIRIECRAIFLRYAANIAECLELHADTQHRLDEFIDSSSIMWFSETSVTLNSFMSTISDYALKSDEYAGRRIRAIMLECADKLSISLGIEPAKKPEEIK